MAAIASQDGSEEVLVLQGTKSASATEESHSEQRELEISGNKARWKLQHDAGLGPVRLNVAPLVLLQVQVALREHIGPPK